MKPISARFEFRLVVSNETSRASSSVVVILFMAGRVESMKALYTGLCGRQPRSATVPGSHRGFEPACPFSFFLENGATGRAALQPQVGQAGMIQRPRCALIPVEQAIVRGDRKVVDAGMAASHQAQCVEFPVFIAVGAEPVACLVVVFICEAYRD